MSTQIRNILQTTQEREVIKTAPDLIVYIESLPYIVNPFVSSSDGQDFTVVNFNQFVQSFSSSYDVDEFIPSCSINMSVPEHLKYMFQVPGGGFVIKSMMELQVFCKGYYPSNNGNSLYHRVFKGLVSSIDLADNGKSLEVSLSGVGIMRLFELMQLDLSPTLMTSSGLPANFYTTRYHSMNPYQMIADYFTDEDLFQEFNVTSFNNDTISSQKIQESIFGEAIAAGYIPKWQAILKNLRNEIFLYGLVSPESALAPAPRKGSLGDDVKPAANQAVVQYTESDLYKNVYLEGIRSFQPDSLPSGSIDIVNGRIVSRLERLRETVQLINFEGYQDVNGTVVIKPPLWNLDCTQLSNNLAIPSSSSNNPNFPKFSQDKNPFIFYLSEIINESERRDEAGVRFTRISCSGVLNPSFQIEMNGAMYPTVMFIDIAKLTRFGLRDQGTVNVGWAYMNSQYDLYSYAIHTLQNSNRGWHTYTVTIPLRPELKLGFTAYIPHKDIYGYIKNIAINYQLTGEAVMTVTLDTIRERPMFPVKTTYNGKEITMYSKQENLIWEFTSSSPQATKTTNGAPTNKTTNTKLVGNPGTLPALQSMTPDQQKLLDYRMNVLKNFIGTAPDDPTHNFRAQTDDSHIFDHFRLVDESYTRDTIKALPYTNEKGYELLSPYPWGRFASLPQALFDFTINDNIGAKENNKSTTVSGINSFLMAGLVVPSNSTAGDTLTTQNEAITSLVNQTTIFELSFDTSSNLDLAPTPDEKIVNEVEADLNQQLNNRVTTMVSGTIYPQTNSKSKTIQNNTTSPTLNDVIENTELDA